MTRHIDIEQALRGYFRTEAADPEFDLSSPTAVSDVSDILVGQRQRPGWLVEVLGNGTVAAPRYDWQAGMRRAAFLLVLGLIVLVTIWIVGQQPPPLPGRGLLAFSRDGDIYLADHDGRSPIRILHEDGLRLAVDSWSADGRWLMVNYATEALGGQVILVESGTLRVLRVEGWGGVWAPRGSALALNRGDYATGLEVTILEPTTGDRRVASGELIGWSPDGSELAVRDGERLTLVRADTGQRREVGAIPRSGVLFDLRRSPDGRWIYGRLAEAESDIVRVDVQSGEMTTIVRGRPSDQQPFDLSPDGRWLVVVMDAGLPSPGSDLVRIDASTGEAKVLVESVHDPRASWAPDSARLVFRDFPSHLKVIGADGTGLAQITPPNVEEWAFPAWSPDGEWITYWGESDVNDVHLMATRPDGRESRVVTSGMPIVRSPRSGPPYVERWSAWAAWQPIARGATPPTLPVLASVQPTPPSEEPVAPPSGPPADPPSSLGGFAIAAGCRIEWFEFAPSDRVPPAALPECERSSVPRWAPDATAVMFDAHPGYLDSGEPAGPDRFVILARDGTVLLDHRPPGPQGANDTTPTFEWSEDGQWLVGGDAVMRPDGSDETQLPGQPSWSPGGSRVAVTSPDGNLLVGRGLEDLRPIGRFPLPSSWAPDGSRFAFVRDGNAWVADADGGGVRAVTDFPLGGAIDISWSPAGDLLLVQRGTALFLVAVDSGDTRMLGIEAEARAAVWSPDGSSIAFADHGGYGGPDASTSLVNVTDGSALVLDSASQPVWSPDGQFLAVMSAGPVRPAELPHIDVVRRDGSGRQTMWTAERDGLYSFVWFTNG